MGVVLVLGLALAGCGSGARIQGSATSEGDDSGDSTASDGGESEGDSGAECAGLGDACGTGCCSGLICDYDGVCQDEAEWGDEGDDTCQFYAGCPGDIQPPDLMCDLWNPADCPEGEKCTAWATQGSSWDANKCVMVQGDAQPGDDCIATDGNSVSGNDDCAKGSMCWDIDVDTGIGYCAAFCAGSPNAPECEGETVCSIYNNGVLPLCLPMCNPLNGGADCPNPDNVCVAAPSGDGFVCVFDGSPMGAYGTECQYVNSCAQGLFCADAKTVPGCQGSQGCCSEFCDLDEPNLCSGKDGGQECIPWFEENMAPPGYESLGGCAIPD